MPASVKKCWNGPLETVTKGASGRFVRNSIVVIGKVLNSSVSRFERGGGRRNFKDTDLGTRHRLQHWRLNGNATMFKLSKWPVTTFLPPLKNRMMLSVSKGLVSSGWYVTYPPYVVLVESAVQVYGWMQGWNLIPQR